MCIALDRRQVFLARWLMGIIVKVDVTLIDEHR